MVSYADAKMDNVESIQLVHRRTGIAVHDRCGNPCRLVIMYGGVVGCKTASTRANHEIEGGV